MPSTFRASRSGRHLESNRTRTGQIDHDVFEGLPVRRWSRQPQTISQAPKSEESSFAIQGPGGTSALPELAMPRDSTLLPSMSRALLRAARAGCIYVRSSGRASEADDKENLGDVDEAAALNDRSFTSRKWTTIPKHMEPSEVEFLAKRRPGLPSLYGGAAGSDGSGAPNFRKTKFKKVDPDTGKVTIYDAFVPEGHRIEGEITGDVQAISGQGDAGVQPEMPVPGTVVEGVGVVNAEGVVVAEAGSAAVMEPPKRRPPPPKRKGKGIGKGRKKKVMFAPGEGADAATVHGTIAGGEGGIGGGKDGQDPSHLSQFGQDDDDDDGEEGDESDDGDESMMDAKTPDTPGAPETPGAADTPGAISVTESTDQRLDDTPAEMKDVDMTDVAGESQQAQAPEPASLPESISQSATAPEVTKAEDAQIDSNASLDISAAPVVEKSEPLSVENTPITSEQAGSTETPEQPLAAGPSGLEETVTTKPEEAPKEEPKASEPSPPTQDIPAAEPVPVQGAAPGLSEAHTDEVKGKSETTPAPTSLAPDNSTEAPEQQDKAESENPADLPAQTEAAEVKEASQEPTIPEASESVPAPQSTEVKEVDTKASLDSTGQPDASKTEEIKEDIEMGEDLSEAKPEQSISAPKDEEVSPPSATPALNPPVSEKPTDLPASEPGSTEGPQESAPAPAEEETKPEDLTDAPVPPTDEKQEPTSAPNEQVSVDEPAAEEKQESSEPAPAPDASDAT